MEKGIWSGKLKLEKDQILKKIGWLLFYLYIIFLSYFLFFSERYGRSHMSVDYRYNLELFKEIKRFIKYRERIGFENFIVNILGNVLAFTPYGFLLPLLNVRYQKFIWILFLSFLFTLTVEVIQLVFKVGIFDVDDLFLNTVGGIIGFLFYKLLTYIGIKSKNKAQGGKQGVKEEK